MNEHKISIDIGGRTLTFETGKLAKQSNGAVIVKQDDSSVLVTTCASKNDVDFGFLPLTVIYQDRSASYGTIPGGFLKREGRPNERETLISRLIDRPLRPQFAKHFSRELQVIATVMSYDVNSDTDVLALCAASASVAVSDIPMGPPVAAVRISRVDGEFFINPSLSQIAEADITLVVAGSRDGISMVEGGANEADEDSMMQAMELAFEEIQKIISAIESLVEKVGPVKFDIGDAPVPDESVMDKMVSMGAGDALKTGLAVAGKFERGAALKAARNGMIQSLVDGKDGAEVAEITGSAKEAWEKLLRKEVRTQVVSEGLRIDGRQTDEIRHIWSETGISPRAHGSVVFTRGETQSFVTATLGVGRDSQRIDNPGVSEERTWMLQYNFPPYCTGEVRRMTGPKRREIGHGALAHRALIPVLPDQEDFPYVLRCSSDVLESNGSSSMATVCGATLSLQDAGVPLKAPVAGIAMGLIKEGDKYVVLSDILGDEDHLGDMDFKVTGTHTGITAFQMDTKLGSIPREIMKKAMVQAKEGRIHILDKMAEELSSHRDELSQHAPRITTVYIKMDKIRDLIGPGGRTIRGIQDQCNVNINNNDDGRIDIFATSEAGGKRAEEMIREITQEPEVGKIYLGIVKRVVDFGAFVEIFPGAEGLVHISELANHRVAKVTDVTKEGAELLVKVIRPDKQGKLKLSHKQAVGENPAEA